jgi:hypothetical protein
MAWGLELYADATAEFESEEFERLLEDAARVAPPGS